MTGSGNAALEPLVVRLAADGASLDPAGVVVGSADLGPAVAGLDHAERLAGQDLGDALGRLFGLGEHGRQLADRLHAREDNALLAIEHVFA